jgi:8-oxo-dGTP diphosphatase
VLLVEAGRLAVIERIRDGRRYHTLPGGGCEPGERPEDAAVREAREELGVSVQLVGLAAIVHFRGNPQYYFVARTTGGAFGHGDGVELASPPESPSGSYRAVWLPLTGLVDADLRPGPLAATLQAGAGRIHELFDTLLSAPAVFEE